MFLTAEDENTDSRAVRLDGIAIASINEGVADKPLQRTRCAKAHQGYCWAVTFNCDQDAKNKKGNKKTTARAGDLARPWRG